MGRHSIKKEKLFVVYKVLRCTMTPDDVVVLKDMFPEFEDVTETTNDDEILQSIFKISQAMIVSQPCNIKEPVEIKAVQFNGSLESYRNIVHTLQIPENEIVFDSFNMEINIQTLEGIHIASHGDWIIKGVKGEFYPCKPDIFDLTYEEVVI